MPRRKSSTLCPRVALLGGLLLFQLGCGGGSGHPMAAGLRVGPEWRGSPQEAFYTSRIVKKYACSSCHTIGDRGGSVGPVLNLVGFRRSAEWIRTWLKDPNAVKNGTKMPKFPFPPEDLDLAVKLLSQMQRPFHTEEILAGAGSLVEKGEKLFKDFDCLACHKIGITGRTVGPDLTWLGVRKTRAWERVWLKDPSAYKPGTFMPNFHLSEPAIEALTAFLETLRGQKNEEARLKEEALAEFFALTDAQQGEHVWKRLACWSCHGEEGWGGVVNKNMGPEEEMPELRTVTQRLSEEEIMEKIRKGGATPPKLNPGGPEPPYRCPPYDKALNERDMRVLMAYLKSMAPERKRFKFN